MQLALSDTRCKHGTPGGARFCATCTDTGRRASRPAQATPCTRTVEPREPRRRIGTYVHLPQLTPNELERLRSFIRKDPSGCHIWEPSETSPDREQEFRIRGWRYQVTRLMYAAMFPHAEIDSLLITHKPCCSNVGGWRAGVLVPLCVNPHHLEPGDPRTASANAHSRAGGTQ